MIPHTSLPLESLGWQEELSRAIRDPRELFRLLELNPAYLSKAIEAHGDFKLMVPRPYLARMTRGDINDPLLAQVLPTAAELVTTPGYSLDPLGESEANPAPGLIHKYHGRVLLIASPACAIHCRYCFRRHFPYELNQPGRRQWSQALDYIDQDLSIREVILSGGDPLAANDQLLSWLVKEIAAIPHVRRLRVHTRFPVVIPQRINQSCLGWLSATRLKVVFVLHVNHPQELDDDIARSVSKLRAANVDVLNQSVILRGVNDCAETLADLSEKLHQTGVLPYYLHQLDAVQGAAHFSMSKNQLKLLQTELLGRLPGYLVPKFVREEAGADSKQLL